MNTILKNKLENNVDILLNLKKGEILISNRGLLMKQDDFVQVDSNLEIEYALFFTFTELLGQGLFDDLNYLKYDQLIKNIDRCIDNVFNNTQLNNMIETDENIHNIIDHIEDLFDTMKDKLFYYSPFFNIINKTNNFYLYIMDILKENNYYITKVSGIYQNTYLTDTECDDSEGLDDSEDNNEDLDDSEDNSEDNSEDLDDKKIQ